MVTVIPLGQAAVIALRSTAKSSREPAGNRGV
jgi:hypothetical protein